MTHSIRFTPPRVNPGVKPVVVLMTGLLALLFSLRNPLFYAMAPGFDASLFAVMGKMWSEGGVLYRDMIDIKGPMIFALDALGYRLGGFVGIWALEWGLCWLGLLASWQAFAQLGLSFRARLGAMLAVLALYGTRYYYGNMTEDWTFHLALIAQWAFITLLLDKRFEWWPALVAALTFAIVAWMRTNNGAFWGGWYLVLFCHWCLHEKWRDALLLLLSSLLGLALIGGPLYAYFQQHDLLAAFKYYAFDIFFEGSYGNGVSPAVGAVGLFRTGLIMLLPPFILLMLGRRQEWYLPVLLVTLFGVLFTLIANSVSGHVFDHYDVLYLQLGLLPLAVLLDRSEQQADAMGLLCISLVVLTASWLLAQQLGYGWSTKEWSLARVNEVLGNSLLWALPVLILVPLWRAWDVRSATPWLATLAMLMLMINNAWEGTQKGRPFNPPAQVRVDRIKAETTPSDKIWVDGIQPQYYLWTDRQPASAYLFFANVNPPYDVRERVLADIQRQQPKFIIAKPERVSEELKKPTSPSHLAFYQYLTSRYEEVDPGLYRRR
ncbi:hypothetical protein ACW5WK_05005 [Aeromonas enteropelogenes]|uniref:hypothetical protein n=1 Tax=Aeromonas enteropelogenes TaxID=29489 RepID=UPI0005A72C34|nr:hypothetical protein [Aeromonas enteropelogenes]UBH56797.1 hypothetical protein LA341_02440 [Aeromonas enteropelogenes]